MTDSILDSIKEMIGPGNYDMFETDLIIHINSAIGVATQVGIGPQDGFTITGSSETWSDFITNDEKKTLEFVKTFVYLKCRLYFDPPQSGVATDAMEKMADELLWRMEVAAHKYGT